MLSLKKLKSIEAAPAITDEVIEAAYLEISNEDSYDEEPAPVIAVRNETGIAMLVRMFKKHSAYLTPVVGKSESYKKCWLKDMETLIYQNGITKDEFELCLSQ